MARLTQKKASGGWQVKGISWEKLREGETITKKISQTLYGCLCKLKDYEDVGMDPYQLENGRYELEEVLIHVCDKLCRYPREAADQEELDAVCARCLVSAGLGRILAAEQAEKNRTGGKVDFAEG